MLDIRADEAATTYRSIDPDYRDLVIREDYLYWTLMLSDNQRFIGTTIAWLVRPGKMQKLTDLTDAELLELKQVCRDVEFALYHLWRPDHMNYEMLGNRFDLHGGHGHVHLIPRYAKPIRWSGRNYFDNRWGRHPHVDGDKVTLPRDALHALRDDIKYKLPDLAR